MNIGLSGYDAFYIKFMIRDNDLGAVSSCLCI